MLESEFPIRPAEIFDLPKLKPLWLEFMKYHETEGRKYRFFPNEWPTVLNRFTKSLEKKHSIIYLAENQGQLIGYTFGFIFINYPGYFPKEIGFINDFLVTTSYRHKGIGLKLFNKIEGWFRSQGVDIVQLYVSYPNQLGKNFWKKCGFENYLVGMWKDI